MTDKHRIFLSHKRSDESAARDLKRILEGRSGRLKVKIFESKAGGVQWQDWIVETLRGADMLLLLYTNPVEEWDWCMYETGLFTPLRSSVKKPVICLYDPNGEPPKPLQGLEAVKIETKELIEKFLDPLFRSNQLVPAEPFLNKNLTDSLLKSDAESIVKAVCPRRASPRYYLDRMEIGPVDAEAIKGSDRIPNDTPIMTPTERGLNVLNYREQSFTWGKLKSQAERPASGTYWIDELEAAIAVAIGKKDPPVLTSTFRGTGAGRIFRPVLYRECRENGVPRCFFVAFNEEIEPELVGVPGNCGIAFNVLRIAIRFRGEVIDPFINRFGRAKGVDEVRARCRELTDSILAIEDESQRHGHLGPNVLIELFSPANRPEVNQALEDWQKIRQDLFEEAEAESPNVGMILDALHRLRAMNRQFMSLLSLRLHELLAVEAQNADPTTGHLEAAV